MNHADAEDCLGVPSHVDLQSHDVRGDATKHQDEPHDEDTEAELGVQRAIRANTPATDTQGNHGCSNHESHRNETKYSVHYPIPTPVFLPIAVGADLEEADQGPRDPHKDTVEVVLQIVIDSLACASTI